MYHWPLLSQANFDYMITHLNTSMDFTTGHSVLKQLIRVKKSYLKAKFHKDKTEATSNPFLSFLQG